MHGRIVPPAHGPLSIPPDHVHRCSVSETVAFIVLLGTLVVWVAWGLWQRRREHAMWAAYAARRGWRHTPGGFLRAQCIGGTLDGGEVEVSAEWRGSRGQRTRYTRCTARIDAPLPAGFGVAPRTVLDRIVRGLGANDLKTGDAHFDDAVVLYGRDPAEVRAFLATSAMRQAMRDVASAGARVYERHVSWSHIGAVANEQDLHDRIEAARALAAAIEAAAPRR